MTYKTNFGIGDEVYLFDKEAEGVHITRDTVEEILIKKDSVKYYLKDEYDEVSEEDIILASAPADDIVRIIYSKTERVD